MLKEFYILPELLLFYYTQSTSSIANNDILIQKQTENVKISNLATNNHIIISNDNFVYLIVRWHELMQTLPESIFITFNREVNWIDFEKNIDYDTEKEQFNQFDIIVSSTSFDKTFRDEKTPDKTIIEFKVAGFFFFDEIDERFEIIQRVIQNIATDKNPNLKDFFNWLSNDNSLEYKTSNFQLKKEKNKITVYDIYHLSQAIEDPNFILKKWIISPDNLAYLAVKWEKLIISKPTKAYMILNHETNWLTVEADYPSQNRFLGERNHTERLEFPFY